MQSPETGTYLERSKDSGRAPILMNIHVKKKKVDLTIQKKNTW